LEEENGKGVSKYSEVKVIGELGKIMKNDGYNKNEDYSHLSKSERKEMWGYPPFNEWIWKSYDNTEAVSIDGFITRNIDNRLTKPHFYIGTDSQTKKGKTTLTTALIAYHMGKGGNIIIHTQKLPNSPSLRQKLIAEAMRSLETAWYINPLIHEESNIIIHVDVNSDLKWRSGQYRDELVGMIMAQGFDLSIKPDAWGATNVADKRCKKY